MAIDLDLRELRLTCRGIRLSAIEPLVDGAVPPHSRAELSDGRISWQLEHGTATLEIEGGAELRLHFRVEGIDPTCSISSLGLRIGLVEGARLYLRNGYHSWDGSFFVEPGTLLGEGPHAKDPTFGFAMTALLPKEADGAIVIGFARQDRFQGRFDFGGTAERPYFDAQTLWDRVPHNGVVTAEPLILLEEDQVETALRSWSKLVAAESPLQPRIPARRITGWCSWYNLYAAIDERLILDHLAAAATFRDEHRVPFDIFQIDDGFTPEMGDWLAVKPQFPRGMKPLLKDIEEAGFIPGLWIAPFLVGNRSRIYEQHPDWVVQHVSGGPLVHMKFYGEFRWHKRSEEYYVLDVTQPDAAAYIRSVLRTWRNDWGARYFKTDFMNAGMEYGPAEARWHEAGLSRVQIWRRMAVIIREEIGDALWLGCGCPLWASTGLVDAARIGRDIGVSWNGEYSAESLLRDQLTRNHASGVLWQADPDCVLLRDRFHELTNEEVHSLLMFAALSGGVLMTSDKLDEIPFERAELFAALLAEPSIKCDFPRLGDAQDFIVQKVSRGDGSTFINLFNPTDREVQPEASDLLGERSPSLPPHASSIFERN